MNNFRIRLASLILGVRPASPPHAPPQADMRRAVHVLRSDLGFMALLAGVLVALIVTTPATFLIVQPFHSDSPLLAILAVALIGLAAVICKLMTLVLPEFRFWLDVLTIALLAVEWFSNYAHGLDLFGSAALGSTFGAIRTAGYGDVAALIYASIPPIFLFAFLTMAVARARRLLYNLDALEVERKLAPVREALQIAQALRLELAALDGFGLRAPAQPPQPALPPPQDDGADDEALTLDDLEAPQGDGLPPQLADLRALAARMRADGKSWNEIAVAVGRSVATVRGWLAVPATDDV